jgi:hypothetical protein
LATFWSAIFRPPIAAKASAKAASPTAEYDLLARALPASALCRRRSPTCWGSNEASRAALNFDLEANGRLPGAWPVQGHTGTSDVGRWLHSDFKNVARPFVYPMYRELILKGDLQ